MKITRHHALLGFLSAALLTGSALHSQAATPMAGDEAYVTLSGKVTRIIDEDEFVLNYGGGQIDVDTNDAWPNLFKPAANQATKALSKGDRVTVTGRIDDDWFGDRELEAATLRHENSGKVVDYSATRSYDGLPEFNDNDKIDEGYVSVTGTITKAMNRNRYEMRYANGGRIEIDTTGITGGKDKHFNVGDRVTVTGQLDDTFFGDREINVNTIQRLNMASSR